MLAGEGVAQPEGPRTEPKSPKRGRCESEISHDTSRRGPPGELGWGIAQRESFGLYVTDFPEQPKSFGVTWGYNWSYQGGSLWGGSLGGPEEGGSLGGRHLAARGGVANCMGVT